MNGQRCGTCVKWDAAAAAKSLQSCPTLCNPIDGSPPGCPVPGILQARTLEWVAISFSNAWKWKVKVKLLSCVRLLVTPWTAAYQTPPSMGFSRQEYWSGVPLPSPNGMLLSHNKEWTNSMYSNTEGLEIIILSTTSQKEKDKYNYHCTWKLKYGTNEVICKTETNSQTWRRLVVTKGEESGRGVDWKFEMQTIIYRIKSILLYSTGGYIQYSGINYNARNIKRNVQICITESLCCIAEINKTL